MDQLSIAPIILSIFGGGYDIFTKRIPNWITFSGILFGLGTQCFLFGYAGLLVSALGILAGFACFFPIYLLGYMGAGDVKLLMLVGAWLGYAKCGETAIGAILLGGVFAIFDTLFRGRLVAVAYSIFRFLRAILVPDLETEPLKIDRNRRFSFGPCIAFGLLGVTLMHQRGWL